MTALETRSLAPGDLVACGKHVGRVVSLAMYTVRIEWKPGQPTTHERDQMGKIQPADAEARGYAAMLADDARDKAADDKIRRAGGTHVDR